MITTEKGKALMIGTEPELLTDFTVILLAVLDKFGPEFLDLTLEGIEHVMGESDE